MNNKLNQIIDLLKTLTLLEVNELVLNIEKTFAIDNMTGINTIITPSSTILTSPITEVAEEKTLFSITLEQVPTDKKIAILKIVRTITGLGLKESKDIVDTVPKLLKENISKEECDKIKLDIESFGGKISIK